MEDEAYCLMGIFGVNMPTLYGEGQNAFYRLQEEIMKTSCDTSLFAWGRFQAPGCGHETTSWSEVSSQTYLFAPSPSFFTEYSNVVSDGPITAAAEAVSLLEAAKQDLRSLRLMIRIIG